MEKKKKKNSTVYVHRATTITVIHLLFVCESSTSVATQLVGGHTRLATLTRHLLSIGHAIRLFDGWDGQKKKKEKGITNVPHERNRRYIGVVHTKNPPPAPLCLGRHRTSFSKPLTSPSRNLSYFVR